jgi:hypothetical protein
VLCDLRFKSLNRQAMLLVVNVYMYVLKNTNSDRQISVEKGPPSYLCTFWGQIGSTPVICLQDGAMNHLVVFWWKEFVVVFLPMMHTSPIHKLHK